MKIYDSNLMPKILNIYNKIIITEIWYLACISKFKINCKYILQNYSTDYIHRTLMKSSRTSLVCNIRHNFSKRKCNDSKCELDLFPMIS